MKVPPLGAFSDVLPMPRLARNWKRSWTLEMMSRWMESQSLWLQLSSRYVGPSNSAVWANHAFLLLVRKQHESLRGGMIQSRAGQGRGVAQTISSKAHSQLTALSSMCTNVSVWPSGGCFNVQVCAVALKPVFHFAPPLYKTASTSSSSNIYLQSNYGFCAGIISQYHDISWTQQFRC